MNVHNHGTEEGDGLACREHLLGSCMIGALQASEYRVGFEAGRSAVALREREAAAKALEDLADEVPTFSVHGMSGADWLRARAARVRGVGA